MSTIEQTSTLTIKKRLPPTKKAQSKELLKRLPFLHKTSNSSPTVSSATPSELIKSTPVKSQSSDKSTNVTDRNVTEAPKLNLKSLKQMSEETTEAGESAPKPMKRNIAYSFQEKIPEMVTSKNVITDEDKFDACSERSMSIESDSTNEGSY